MARPARTVVSIVLAAVAVLALALAGARATGMFAGLPPRLGVTADGRLTACRPTPNCVSSQADPADAVHYVAPLAFPPRAGGAPGAAFAELRRVVAGGPRATIVGGAPGYLRAEYRSRIVGFVDDVEFLLDTGARTIHVRSASRLGRSDLGVNRARVEAIRAALAGP